MFVVHQNVAFHQSVCVCLPPIPCVHQKSIWRQLKYYYETVQLTNNHPEWLYYHIRLRKVRDLILLRGYFIKIWRKNNMETSATFHPCPCCNILIRGVTIWLNTQEFTGWFYLFASNCSSILTSALAFNTPYMSFSLFPSFKANDLLHYMNVPSQKYTSKRWLLGHLSGSGM